MYKDLFKSMRLGAILGLISNIIQDVSAVFIAIVLGTFTSAVLNSDIKMMKSSIYKLLIAILITVVLIPIFQILSNKIILKNSFTHENLLIDRYLKFDESILRDIKSYKFDNIIEKEATMLRLNFIWAFQNISEALIIVLILIISLKELPIYYFIFIVAMGFLRFVSFTTFKNQVSEYTRNKYTFKENERKILFSCSFEKDWLKFNNLYTKFIQIYRELFDEYLKDKISRGEMYTKTQNAVRNLADGLFLILVVGFGIILCSKQIIGINSVIKILAMSVVINKFFDCVKKSVDSFIQLKSLKVNVGKFYSIIPEDKVSNNGNSEIEINAKNLSYTVNDKNILKPVNFIIKKGDKVKISGENGTGSATTAHAVMQLNAEDGGNRKFIMVQLPEQTDEKSEAYKAGYKNICEIGKERIRRAGEKILEENKDKENIDKLDVGFRVLKTDSSNMKDVYYSPENTEQSFLDNLEDNIKEDRTQEDLLFQVMLDLGVPLSSTIEVEQIEDAKVFKVEDRFLVACFDGAISDDVVKQIADMKPFYAVFRDMSMKNDSVAVNFEQIFESISPETIRKVL